MSGRDKVNAVLNILLDYILQPKGVVTQIVRDANIAVLETELLGKGSFPQVHIHYHNLLVTVSKTGCHIRSHKGLSCAHIK